MEQAMITDIKRFAIHDGDGIRTTVFFKGCPLRCRWCHNPEGLRFQQELAFYEDKCMNCGECEKVCDAGVHRVTEYGHLLQRELCNGCGRCENACLGNALKLFGHLVTLEELMPVLLEDRLFYDNSGGGVTLSGGECLMQAEFCAELLRKLKAEKIHTAVDTCGYVDRKKLELVIPYTDVFLYDIKAIDEAVHRMHTGHGNKVILENLVYLDSCHKKIEVRIPYVPECNADQMERIADYLAELKSLDKVRILPYHNFAGSKYRALSRKNELPEKLPETDELRMVYSLFTERGLQVE